MSILYHVLRINSIRTATGQSGFLRGYDEDESAGDQKTVVVRAWRFKNEWVESLASRLGREFPFLWRLEVGREPQPLRRHEWDDTFVQVPEKSFCMDDGSALTV